MAVGIDNVVRLQKNFLQSNSERPQAIYCTT